MNLKPIYTEPNDCRDCYKCIRECPVKAIQVINNMASIDDEKCIYCGHCVNICPAGAKKVRDGISRAKFVITNTPKVIVSIAPSFVSEFSDLTDGQLISAIKELGFYGVSETAIGADAVSAEVNKYLKKEKGGIHISSACPVVVELIKKKYPQHTGMITPFLSPMLTHAKILKQIYGNEIGIVFIGPCIAKKLEADEFSDLVDAVISFRDLKRWLASEKIAPEEIEADIKEEFIPYRASSGTLYPIDGGMINSMKRDVTATDSNYMSFSGLENIKDILNDISEHKSEEGNIFLELLACNGGCVNGPGRLKQRSEAKKRYDVIRHTNNKYICRPDEIDLSRVFPEPTIVTEKRYTEEEIKFSLSLVGKQTEKDELNCSGCGYDSCRDFAIAMLDGRAERNMCVSYMRKVAQNKATVLLQKIPSGVVIVDHELRVVEMNIALAKMLGEEVEAVFKAQPGMAGASLMKLTELYKNFSTALSTGHEIYEKDVIDNGKLFQLSIFNIQPNKIVCGIFQNRHHPEVKKDIVVKRTQEVIKRNMETVQHIAYLLGENAAYTDSLLNSILDTQKEEEKE